MNEHCFLGSYICFKEYNLLIVLVKKSHSLQANSNDDRGVLTGRWTETYPKNSTQPWEWTGSIEIIEKYMKRKTPVKYGQCWVFSGLVTTCKLVTY